MSWGEPGPGKWVTIYSNPGHVYLEVAGIRFDTSGRAQTGSRWQNELRSHAGFVARPLTRLGVPTPSSALGGGSMKGVQLVIS
jgi:hypothetical protein